CSGHTLRPSVCDLRIADRTPRLWEEAARSILMRSSRCGLLRSLLTRLDYGREQSRHPRPAFGQLVQLVVGIARGPVPFRWRLPGALSTLARRWCLSE